MTARVRSRLVAAGAAAAPAGPVADRRGPGGRLGGESVGMGAYDEDFATTPVMREDHSGRPVRIGPGELSTVTYLVRAEPRSKSAAGRAAGCRITYRSAHRVYVEELGADFFLGPMRG
ncbi:hypothetical protein ACPCSC_04485 [Streptomyces lavendulocolor]|uniref:hypothetical protein n=1 Tax=Streptomyces lavendulocolor TaxID=67316 RepID=UPI003C2C1FC5